MVQAPCQPLEIAGEFLAMRPIRPDDTLRLRAFASSLWSDCTCCRLLERVGHWTPQLLQRLDAIDFSQDMALVVVRRYGLADEEVVAIGGYFGDGRTRGCEFALAVSDQWRHQGLGRLLMEKLLACAVSHGY